MAGNLAHSSQGLWLYAGIGLVFMLPGAVEASSLRIDFDLSGSRLELLGGQISIPRDGAVRPGARLAIEIPLRDGEPTSGTATLKGLRLVADFEAELLAGGIDLIGRVGSEQLGPAEGILADDLSFLLVGGAEFDLSLETACDGPSCSLLGLGNDSVSHRVFDPGGRFDVGSLSQPGAATLSFEGAFEVNGLRFELDLVGSEVGRNVVPEPSTAILLGIGQLAFAWRRRINRPKLSAGRETMARQEASHS